MSERPFLMMDGNEAAASVAYRTNEVIAIYPITPASPMGELADQWSVDSRPNLWGAVPDVVEMQSEGGAAGAVHGALQAGALTTTFTASQGLLLMVPDLYKIAGELNAFCLHVAARTVATHALSIFGDHSDVMACRQIGVALLASGSVQEAQDLALVAQASTLQSRIPFLHFFDGFRTSHEVAKIEALTDDDFRTLIDEAAVEAHRRRALTPDRPVLRGSAQNPDTFFQAREACNRHYQACPDIVQENMDRLAARTGRRYRLFDYFGHPEAERVVVLMGSGGETARETVEHLAGRGERVGAVLVRLYRPFDIGRFVEALPPTTRGLAVLDRTKEPGAVGEPLYLDVQVALQEARSTGRIGSDLASTVIGGRYGLSSKEFSPGMVRGVLDELGRETPKNHFTIGIMDDVTGTSLPWEEGLDIEPEGRIRALFYGLGSDGTVGANKNSVKIIGEGTEHYSQGYFVYDSRKAGAVTISHLRFGEEPIRAPYLLRKAGFVACHQFEFLERYDVLEHAAEGGTFLLNAPYGPDEIWEHLPREIQEGILERKLRFYVIDAYRIAREAGLGGRINTIMQTAFFAISGVLPREQAVEGIKDAIKKTYETKGDQVVRQNFEAVDRSLSGLHVVETAGRAAAGDPRPPQVPAEAPDLVQKVTAVMMANQGDLLPVSAFPVDGTWPVGTTRWEKRNIAQEIPVWDPAICIQCNKCALVCPHAAIRAKVYEPAALAGAPETFQSTGCRGADHRGSSFTIQVAPEDCTGCTLCVRVCPAKDRSNPRHKAIDMKPQRPIREQERENYAFFLDIPEIDRTRVKLDNKGSQLLQPLFEYSGACAGCGETPYIKLLTQLFGDRLLIANATGCSSIYGGNLPTVPYATNADGRGPAWSNSLFEDNAEFGFGMRLAVDSNSAQARSLLRSLTLEVGRDVVQAIVEADQGSESAIAAQRERVERLREVLRGIDDDRAARLRVLADYLVHKSIWLIGGDGWAYDIGYGGLDHVLSTNRNVNVLVLDTEVYSNTGGQQSKATPMAAAAKFAMAGKESPKKDLGMMAMSYGHVYVARIAFGAKDTQTVKALLEAESYPGPSLVIAYSHCIAHGYSLASGVDQQKLAVDSGVWPLYRFDPRVAAEGKPPLHVDSGEPKVDPEQYMRNEARFLLARKSDPVRYRRLLDRARHASRQRFAVYEQLAALTIPQFRDPEPEPAAETAAATDAGDPERSV
ncbi:MAG: pyruvate:ferredoxin (flavodoxin) oxidoreductase [Acidobacteriota bacterium]|jgi:pyruvate-ferredoxin/flavodoxin oxidoreductase